MHLGLVTAASSVDCGHGLRHRQFRVRQVEPQRLGKGQRQLVLAALGGDAGEFWQIENVTREGRLRRDTNPHLGYFLLLFDRELLPRHPVGFVGALGEFLNHLARQPGRLAAPVLGQQVDKQLVACNHRADPDLLRQCKPQGAPVGIAPRRANIFVGPRAEPIDRDVYRLPELDDEDAAGHADLRLDVGCGADDEAAVASGGDEAGLTAHALRLSQRRVWRMHERRQQQADDGKQDTLRTHHTHTR